MTAPAIDPGVRAAATLAADLIDNGAKVGLGTGRAASAFIARLGERARGGLSLACVATSEASARQARAAGLTLIDLTPDLELEVTVDGADEVAPNLDLVKGRGGAFVRERIVAASSRRQVIVVGPEKLVGALGETGPIPIEVIPMALGLCVRRLEARGLGAAVRGRAAGGGAPFVSDNGNLIVDVGLPAPLADAAAARALEAALRSIPGVVDTGLFLATAQHVLVGHADGRVDTRQRQD
jgi:ribose 5-phosphate isomerase A